MNASTCAIMQPTYLPWAGYFNLIASVGQFILLDDVQFARGTWQSKNRILLNGKAETLEVPVIKAPLQTRLDQIWIDHEKPWVDRHLSRIETAYRQAPHGAVVLDMIGPILNARHTALVSLNAAIIRAVCQSLGLAIRLSRASELACGGKRSAHVAALCEAVGATVYFSPEGARGYLEEDDFTMRFPIELVYQTYQPQDYPQLGNKPFISHLSIIDVIAHLGPDGAAQYVRGAA